MNRTYTDAAAGSLIIGVLVLGMVVTWQAYLQWVALSGMEGHRGMNPVAVHGTHPAWYLLATVLAAAVVGGVYLSVRERFISGPRSSNPLDSHEKNHLNPAESPADMHGSPQASSTIRVVDLLPEDERRILTPVVESPGLTQIDLRDRSEFSKSKVSQTVTELEKRGLLYREPQGRTFRVYPANDLVPTEGKQ